MLPDRHYEFLAGALILGENSPVLKDLRIYSNPLLWRKTDLGDSLRITETQGLFEGTRRDTKRRLRFATGTILETSHTAVNGIAQIITLINSSNRVRMSDALFNDNEFNYNKHVWLKTLQSRIDRVFVLIKTLHTEYKGDIPMLIDDFPNIAGVFIIHPQALTKGIFDGGHES